MKFASFTILAFFVSISAIGAEQIIMKTGQVYNGRIVNQTRNEVILDTAAGRLVLRKLDIRRITYGPTPEDQTRDARKREEQKKAEEDKKKEDQKLAEEKKKAEEDKNRADQKLADEKRQAEEKQKAEELKKIEDSKKSEEQKAADADRLKKEEEARKAAEEKKQAELLKQQDELKKSEEKKTDELRLTEEQIRERVRQEVQLELQKQEQRRREEERRRLEEEAKRQSQPTRSGAFFRSLVLPGWGQLYQGRRVAGFAYMGGVLGAAAVSNFQDQIYKRRLSEYHDITNTFLFSTPFVTRLLGYAQDDYQASAVFFFGTDQTQKAYNGMAKAAHRGRWARGVALGLYAWNLADVLIFAPRASVGLTPSQDGLNLAFHYQF